jgi:hypothetical protein
MFWNIFHITVIYNIFLGKIFLSYYIPNEATFFFKWFYRHPPVLLIRCIQNNLINFSKFEPRKSEEGKEQTFFAIRRLKLIILTFFFFYSTCQDYKIGSMALPFGKPLLLRIAYSFLHKHTSINTGSFPSFFPAFSYSLTCVFQADFFEFKFIRPL